MKRHIAEFLGELAEELGWEPEFEGQRVVPERHATSGSVAMHDMPSSNEMRLQRLDEEVRHLRSNVNHLSSETTQLRAEMARLKKLPAPPDALSSAPIAPGTGGEVRQWPAHLLPKPAPEPAPPAREAVTGESAKNEKNDTTVAERVREPDPVQASNEEKQEADEQKIEPESPTHSPPVEPPAIQPVLATPIVAEVDNESPLELFPSEPRSASAKNAGASTPAS